MKINALLSSAIAFSVALASDLAGRAPGNISSLVVFTTPQSLRPYVLPKGYGLTQGAGDGGNIYAVTGNSSGKAFCLMISNGGSYGMIAGAGVFPHVHMKTYENFYATKGRVQLWGQNYDDFKANKSTQQTRVLTQGDLGSIPNNTIHTFQLIDPDTTLTGVLVPGGFEELFFEMARDFTMVFNQTKMESYDVYSTPTFVPRTDVVNQEGGTGNWHNGSNPTPDTPNQPGFTAKNYGSRYLNWQYGYYQLIAPLMVGAATDNRFTQGTITMSPKPDNVSVTTFTLPEPFAFQMEEGMLRVHVNGEDVDIIQGDVFFLPANTPFSYWARAQFTKFMYVSKGIDGIDSVVMKNAVPWSSSFYPANGYPANTDNNGYTDAVSKRQLTKKEIEIMKKLPYGVRF